MSEQLQRTILFLVGCIGVRTIFVIEAAKIDEKNLPYFGVLALLLAISWILIYTFNLRPTGGEAGGVIWWNNLRPLHALNYFIFAIMAFKSNKYAWVPLMVDVLIGLVAFLNHRVVSFL